MRITVLTMFPEIFRGFLQFPMILRCIDKGIASIEVRDIKDYADGSFRHIDESPYGGGAGMILRCEPVVRAIRDVRRENSTVIAMAPIGTVFTQKDALELKDAEDIILLAGHYEGFDARIYDYCDRIISMGDFILSSGELPCMALIDSVIRLKEGIIRNESTQDESFMNGLLEYPQYTRPYEFEGKKVPDILLSGNHEKIREYRRMQSLLLTKKNRPDLFEKAELSESEKALFEE
ncbi:MAG: tRNA (guanosine(37)-N1)-methyltransferase TrmD [Solobacterium sp.]|nr:tRNA (guanosine(37)-N1)-methyltransferase TrmD [Solobacterium sp.]